jgi:hypothetical protein
MSAFLSAIVTDEGLEGSVAFAGSVSSVELIGEKICSQLKFDMPFPFNILLLPFEIAEVTIRWAITN